MICVFDFPQMRNIKLTIEYDGTQFKGWQIQKRNQRTVQGEIKRALEKILKEPVTVIGSGRTDSGVHALGQVANFKTHSQRTAKELLNALNANLPEDVAIRKVEEVDTRFHAQFTVKSKTYRYTVLNRVARSAQLRNFCLFYPYKLNIRIMRQEAKALVGRKNFKVFAAADSGKSNRDKTTNTIRTIKRVAIQKEKDFIYIDIEADGFLYKMVRNIVGTLLAIGSGKLPQGSIKAILHKHDKRNVSPPAKAKGLCLLEVKY